jgi:hypothetical protein
LRASLHSKLVTVTSVEDKAPTENSDQVELEPDLPPGVEPDEGSSTKRFIKQSALQQGSNIPTGWKPTVRTPVPVMRCSHIFKDDHPRGGDRCGRWSLRGSRLCYRHSGNGNLKNVEEYRLAIIEAARLQLTEAVPDALATILDLAANSPADNVKLKAATEILDRAGIKTAQELNVNVEVSEASPATTLAERIEKLKKAAEISAEMQRRNAEAQEETLALTAVPVSVIDTADTADSDTEILEGEIVPDTADGGDGG